jgi:predicted RNase H-like HicB family nuclease
MTAQLKPDWLTLLFPLRALAVYDEVHGFYVAHCLETGSVTTAEDMDTVLDMMKEVLEDEVSNVIASENLANFFSTPAPFEIWDRWTRLAQANPGEIKEVELDIKLKAGKDVQRTKTRVAVLAAAA